MKLRRSDVIAVSLFVLLVGVFFRQTLFERKLPIPSDALVGLYHPWRDYYSSHYPRGIPFKNFLITDPVRELIPWRKIAIDQWKEGKIPLWNPYSFSGAPLLGNIQAAALYPFNILFFLFSFADAWTILIILQPLLAGLFMYWYLRSLGIHPSAGLLGAISWSFSGFNIAWLTWGTIDHVVLWLPIALLSLDRVLLKHKSALWHKHVFWSLLFIISMVFQFFAGHAQMSIYFIVLVISYGITRIVRAEDRRTAAFRLILLLTIVAALTAIQWVPLMGWIGYSSRVIDGSGWYKEGWFIPWEHLVQFVAPDFFGNPTTLNYWGKWNYGEFIGYVGLLPLLFAIVAIVSGADMMCLFWLSALVIALLFALPTPIASLPFLVNVPILSSLQPTRLLFVIDFALAILAAFGCNQWIEYGKKRHERIPLIFIGVIFAILWIISYRFSSDVSRRNLLLPTALYVVATVLLAVHDAKHRSIAVWGIVGVLAFDLLRFGWKFTPFTPREYFFPETKIISFLKQQEKPFRVMSVDKRVLPPNTASYFGIESIEGYDPIFTSRYEELLAAVARGKPDIDPPFGFNRILSLEKVDSPLLPMLGARYILSLVVLEEPYLKKVFEEGETIMYEDTRAVPRAFTVERAVKASNKQQAVRALYDIRGYLSEAVVEGDVSLVSIPMRSDEGVSLTGYWANRLDIEAKLAVPRLVVIVNSYHPGWQASIDGVKTTIVRTNYAFQGVVVPEGTHRLTLTYGL